MNESFEIEKVSNITENRWELVKIEIKRFVCKNLTRKIVENSAKKTQKF